MRLIRRKEYLGLVVLFALGISGCYTVLKHPEVAMKDDSENGYRATIGYRDECSSCHTERYSDNTYDHDVALFGNLSRGDDGTINGEQNRAITTHGRRWNYYHYPWWYDYTRGGAVQSGGGSGKTSVDSQYDDSRRNIGSQRGSSPNTINIPPPARSVPSAAGASTSSENTAGSSPQKDARGSVRQDSTSNSRDNSNTTDIRSNDAQRDESSDDGKSDSGGKRTSGSTRGK